MRIILLFYTVSAADTVPPTITSCPQSASYAVSFGFPSTIVTWTEPTATDNCPGTLSRIQSHSSGQDFQVGVTQVRYIFSDTSGNEATCQFTVTGKYTFLLYDIYYIISFTALYFSVRDLLMRCTPLSEYGKYVNKKKKKKKETPFRGWCLDCPI